MYRINNYKKGLLMAEKIKVGVIGTGALGRHHARLYAQNPNAEMVVTDMLYNMELQGK